MNQQYSSFIENIETKNQEEKLLFVQSVINAESIHNNFVPNSKLNVNKIFYSNGVKREWILFEDNRFYCAYCLCYSSWRNHRLINGIECIAGCRITDTLNRHEEEAHHKRAKSVFQERSLNGNNHRQSTMREILKIIVRIIIFIASHGEYNEFWLHAGI